MPERFCYSSDKSMFFFPFKGEMFAVGSFNTLRLCDKTGVSHMVKLQALLSVCHVLQKILNRINALIIRIIQILLSSKLL